MTIRITPTIPAEGPVAEAAVEGNPEAANMTLVTYYLGMINQDSSRLPAPIEEIKGHNLATKRALFEALRREAERQDENEIRLTAEATSGGFHAKIRALGSIVRGIFAGKATSDVSEKDAEAGVCRKKAREIRVLIAQIEGVM